MGESNKSVSNVLILQKMERNSIVVDMAEKLLEKFKEIDQVELEKPQIAADTKEEFVQALVVFFKTPGIMERISEKDLVIDLLMPEQCSDMSLYVDRDGLTKTFLFSDNPEFSNVMPDYDAWYEIIPYPANLTYGIEWRPKIFEALNSISFQMIY